MTTTSKSIMPTNRKLYMEVLERMMGRWDSKKFGTQNRMHIIVMSLIRFSLSLLRLEMLMW